jgi:dipeptidyl aminopeptidase/acylaminoacyl peptidase
VVQVHGGPHTNDGFGFRFEFQRLAAAGYAVVSLNPRGSSSFGEDFATAALLRYGTVDADDVMAVVEHAAAHHDAPDAPVHLTGGSYGGFMTNWLVGHQPERFRSAVTQRSICNWVSFFGTSDIGPWFTEGEVGPAPWLDLDALWRASPLRKVADVVTPTLVLHSEDDHRCPIEQGEQWFSALQAAGDGRRRASSASPARATTSRAAAGRTAGSSGST